MQRTVPLIWDWGWLIEDQEGAVWPWLYVSEIWNIIYIYMYQKLKMENSKNLELRLNVNLFKIYDTMSCMLMYIMYTALLKPEPSGPKICFTKTFNEVLGDDFGHLFYTLDLVQYQGPVYIHRVQDHRSRTMVRRHNFRHNKCFVWTQKPKLLFWVVGGEVGCAVAVLAHVGWFAYFLSFWDSSIHLQPLGWREGLDHIYRCDVYLPSLQYA